MWNGLSKQRKRKKKKEPSLPKLMVYYLKIMKTTIIRMEGEGINIIILFYKEINLIIYFYRKNYI